MRGVDDDELGPWRHLAPEGPDVDCPAGILAELVEGDLGSAAAGHLVEALVAGPGHDRVVARPEDGVDQGEDPLLGAGQDEDVVGRGGVVERGDLVAQERVAGRLRVAEAEVAPERGGLIVGEPSTSLAQRTCRTANSQRAKYRSSSNSAMRIDASCVPARMCAIVERAARSLSPA